MSSFLFRHKRRVMGAAAAVLVLGGVVAGPTLTPTFGPPAALAQLAPNRPASFADVVERVKPAVVSVQARREGGGPSAGLRGRGSPDMGPDDPLWRFFREFRDRGGLPDGPQDPRRGTSQGSGFFISADGFIVTNNHVVDGATNLQIVMDDGTRLDARLVGTDPRTDLALLKAERQQPFPFVRFGQAQPRVGDWVIAIGNPFGLGGTVTAGIVSARGREIGAGPYDDFIQIDAPVNRGNSGGPTFDVDGNVIGINTAIYSPSGGSVGIGFAIPASVAEPVISQLRDGGSVTRGWLGVQIQSVTEEIARSLGLQNAQGALVAEPQPNSPAATAGIRSGDLIVGLNGEPVRDARDLTRRVAAIAPGQTARFDILRNGQRQTVEVTLGRLPGDVARAEPNRTDPRGNGGRGNGGTENTAVLDQLGLELAAGRRGVQVVDLDPQGTAAARGLRNGDIILDVAGESVQRPGDVAARLRAARSDGRASALVRVRSGDQIRFVTLPTG